MDTQAVSDSINVCLSHLSTMRSELEQLILRAIAGELDPDQLLREVASTQTSRVLMQLAAQQIDTMVSENLKLETMIAHYASGWSREELKRQYDASNGARKESA